MKIQELYSSPDKWAQGEPALDKRGIGTSIYGGEAVSWCLIGALYKCYRPSKVSYLKQKIVSTLKIKDKFVKDDGMKLVEWNDDPDRTFNDVKKLVEEMDL